MKAAHWLKQTQHLTTRFWNIIIRIELNPCQGHTTKLFNPGKDPLYPTPSMRTIKCMRGAVMFYNEKPQFFIQAGKYKITFEIVYHLPFISNKLKVRFCPLFILQIHLPQVALPMSLVKHMYSGTWNIIDGHIKLTRSTVHSVEKKIIRRFLLQLFKRHTVIFIHRLFHSAL